MQVDLKKLKPIGIVVILGAAVLALIVCFTADMGIPPKYESVHDADYYLQSVMKEKNAITIGLMHSAILSGLLCMALPALFGMTGVWMALPLADMLTVLAQNKNSRNVWWS